MPLDACASTTHSAICCRPRAHAQDAGLPLPRVRTRFPQRGQTKEKCSTLCNNPFGPIPLRASLCPKFVRHRPYVADICPKLDGAGPSWAASPPKFIGIGLNVLELRGLVVVVPLLPCIHILSALALLSSLLLFLFIVLVIISYEVPFFASSVVCVLLSPLLSLLYQLVYLVLWYCYFVILALCWYAMISVGHVQLVVSGLPSDTILSCHRCLSVCYDCSMCSCVLSVY